jgi:hypothetical protein
MTGQTQDALIQLATEYWRLLRLADKTILNAPADKASSFAAQLRYSESKLRSVCASAGLRLIAYEREKYEPNLPVTVLNAEDGASLEDAVIERTVEPTIIVGGSVVAMGKVLLRSKN